MNDIEICTKCGKPTERWIDFPKMGADGGFERRKVRCLCDCEILAEEEKKRNARKQELEIEVKRLKSMSMMDSHGDVHAKDVKVTEDNKKACEIAGNYIAHFKEMKKRGKGLLFWGEVGTGKSYLSKVIATELMERLVQVTMTSFSRVLAELKNDPMYMDRINTCDLLIIDDFGSERSTDYALEKVFSVIDARYRSGKPLIVTTNITWSEMVNCTDVRYSRIYDRLFAMCYPVEVKGKSWRKKEAMESEQQMKELLGV